jgi:MerR family mercuric resistance operon transcriptional regulator
LVREGDLQAGMTIGRLAKAAGLNVETIRYYQRRGLIDEPRKPFGGHRRYPADAVRRLAFIRHAQQLGFSLEEVKVLLKLADGHHARETRELAEKKRELLDARVEQLDRMRKELARLIAASRKARPGKDPLVEALFSEDDPA